MEQAKRIMITGKTGSGKTNLARILTRKTPRCLWYDSNGGDYRDGVILDGLAELRQYWRRVVDGSFKMVYRSMCPRADFSQVCELVKACGSLTFCIDEVDMYFDKGEPSSEFADLIRRGRRESVEIIGITQRPRRMGELRSMCRELYVFETTEIGDLRFFKESFGDECVEAIRLLQQWEYLYIPMPYDPAKCEVRKEAMDHAARRQPEIHHGKGPCKDAGGECSQGQEDRPGVAAADPETEPEPTGDDPLSPA